MEKQERKEKKILTDNRLVTVNKRERSFEGLADSLENGEDGIYSLITENKNIIFYPKISITQHDLDTIPPLRELRQAIKVYEDALKRCAGTKQAYLLKKALIEMRKDQYIIKQAYQKPFYPSSHVPKYTPSYIKLEDDSYLNKNQIIVQGISLMNPRIVEAILNDYSQLKQDCYDVFNSDIWYLMQIFDDIAGKALRDFPVYETIVTMKVDKASNLEIQRALEMEFGYTFTVEYISNLWRNKIPRIIAKAAREDFLKWEYMKKKWPVKTCTKCCETKPAHNHFFSRNTSSPDGFYSICKKCRNRRKKCLITAKNAVKC